MTKKQAMKIVGEKLKQARKNKQMTQDELAALIPGMSKPQISAYENGRRGVPQDKIEQFAKILEISPIDLIPLEEFHNTPGRTPSNLVPASQFKWGRLAGEVACGCPRCAEYDEDIMLPVGADTALYCVGNSMINIGLSDGDIVYIRYVTDFEEVRNGEIAAVGIGDDYEYTLKRWFFYPDKALLKLVPENDDFKVMIFEGEELQDIHLLGVAVGFTALF